jgi:hypothetical protein
MPGAQRARRRGRLRDRGSPPGQPGYSELLKIIRKKPDCHLKYWFLALKQAAHMTDVCLGPSSDMGWPQGMSKGPWEPRGP